MKNFLKKYIISGTIVLVPIVVTVWILKALILWLDGVMISLIPPQIRPEAFLGYNIPGVGLLFTLILILIIGIFTRLYIGKVFVRAGDKIFSRLPFGRAIYQGIKQVLNNALSDKGQKSRKVVLVEYPKKDSYAIAFKTGEYRIGEGDKNKKIMVFVPTAPNPTSGFLLMVSERDLIDTQMTTEDASKLLISGGLLAKKPQGI